KRSGKRLQSIRVWRDILRRAAAFIPRQRQQRTRAARSSSSMAMSGNGRRVPTSAILAIGRLRAPWASITRSSRATSSSSAALLARPRAVTRAGRIAISSRQRHAGSSPACAWQEMHEFGPLRKLNDYGGLLMALAIWNGVVLAESEDTVVVEG